MASDIKSNIDALKEQLVYLGTVVEESLDKAILTARSLDSRLAIDVQQADDKVNAIEVDIEDACLKILALHQPVASDLRFVVAVLKMNSELERIGDLAGKVGDKVLLIVNNHQEHPEVSTVIQPDHFPTIFQQTREMFSHCLDAFVNHDADLAHRILLADDAVDDSKHHIRNQLKNIVTNHPEQQLFFPFLLSIARIMERIADHATHIAEDTIYMLQGQIIRHSADISRNNH